MDVIHQDIRISLRYPVVFTTGLFRDGNTVLGDLLGEASGADGVANVLFVVDDGVARAWPSLSADIDRYCCRHPAQLRLAAPVLVLAGGELAKNEPGHLERLQQAIHDAALCRHSYVVAVGGGALLDIAGYAAATAHRGVRLIRVPTTVLAQDDSAVGVKNGVNAFGKKNYLGTFAPPFAVLNDFDFLTTLSDRDWRSGLSEAVKVAVIRDPEFFALLESLAPALRGRDGPAMSRVVRRSAELHLAHIATGGDPFELGSSRPLDFGHWAAHKLEQLSGHRLRHGEAVAIGIAVDSMYARLSGVLPDADCDRVLTLLTALGFELDAPELADARGNGLLAGLEEFREHLGGRLTIMLLRGIGRPFDVHDIDRDVMIRSVDAIRTFDAAARAGGAARKAS